MNKTITVCLLSATALLARVEDKETIRQTYPYAARLDVQNVNGSVRVTGYEGNTIQMTVYKTINARDQAGLELGRREVRLDVSSSSDKLRICIDGPWRDLGNP